MSTLWRNLGFYTLGCWKFTKSAYEKKARTAGDAWAKALEVDLTGKSVIVTGANSGLGYATTEALLRRGATVHMVCRSPERGGAAQAKLIEACKANTERCQLHIVDMSIVNQVKTFARDFVESGQRLDVLVNNAGCMVHKHTLTPEGNETNFACNTLGTYVLTEELIPALRRQEQDDEKTEGDFRPRAIAVSSGGMLTTKLDVSDLQSERQKQEDGSMDATMVYAQHKRQQVCLTEHWTRRYKDTGILFQSMHPGWAATPGVQSQIKDFYESNKDKFRTEEQGADTIVWLACSQEMEQFPSGEFFLDREPANKHLMWARTHSTEVEVDNLVAELSRIAR